MAQFVIASQQADAYCMLMNGQVPQNFNKIPQSLFIGLGVMLLMNKLRGKTHFANFSSFSLCCVLLLL